MTKAGGGELVRGVIADVASKATPDRFDFAAFFEELYAHFAQPGVWSAFPEVNEVLSNLKAHGFRLGVISNFDRRLYQIFDGLGLSSFFEQIVISSEVGADKPDPRIFQTALHLGGVFRQCGGPCGRRTGARRGGGGRGDGGL